MDKEIIIKQNSEIIDKLNSVLDTNRELNDTLASILKSVRDIFRSNNKSFENIETSINTITNISVVLKK